jgi:hypothetical protein
MPDTESADASSQAIATKLLAVKAVVASKASGIGAESSWIPEVLHLIIDIIPEIISIFHPSKAAAAVSTGQDGANGAQNGANVPLAVEGGH